MNQVVWVCRRKAWTCESCYCNHPVSPYEIDGAYDACPNCAEITEHSWMPVEPEVPEVPKPRFAVVVVEPDGEQWTYSTRTDRGDAEEDRRTAEAKMPGAKLKVCDWTGL